MSKTSISWTDESWNPVVGCTKISEGCAHCYAERVSKRWGRDFGRVTLHPERLEQPWHWHKPRMVFVNSMSDLFHPDVPDWFILKVFETMACCPQHTFQVLTKRPERMAQLLSGRWPLPNVWIGASAENQQRLDERIVHLLDTPATVHFLSLEPVLGPIELGTWFWSAMNPYHKCHVEWVIMGGESGPNYRPDNIDWYKAVRDQCQAAGVPFFLKQYAGIWPGVVWPLEGKEHREFPRVG